MITKNHLSKSNCEQWWFNPIYLTHYHENVNPRAILITPCLTPRNESSTTNWNKRANDCKAHRLNVEWKMCCLSKLQQFSTRFHPNKPTNRRGRGHTICLHQFEIRTLSLFATFVKKFCSKKVKKQRGEVIIYSPLNSWVIKLNSRCLWRLFLPNDDKLVGFYEWGWNMKRLHRRSKLVYLPCLLRWRSEPKPLLHGDHR